MRRATRARGPHWLLAARRGRLQRSTHLQSMPTPNWQNSKTINLPNLPGGFIVLGFWLLVALIFLWTGFYTVPADSEGVVLRFGGYHETVKAGPHFKIPYGVDKV